MSGIYLIVWDKGNRPHWGKILQPTKAGWPHVTLAYTGKHLNREELIQIATDVSPEWTLKHVTLTKAFVYSFENLPGHFRHDVLVEIEECKQIEESRQKFIRDKFAYHSNFAMSIPHVTISIFENIKDAESRAAEVNELLPHRILVTGVTVS